MAERRLESCSGPWGGFWLQFGHRGVMRVHLTFEGGAIGGQGQDSSGDFTMDGVYTADGQVSLRKAYSAVSVVLRDAAPLLVYEGRWDGRLIFGTWHQHDDSWNTGEFELWPESEEDLAERSLALQEDALVAGPRPG